MAARQTVYGHVSTYDVDGLVMGKSASGYYGGSLKPTKKEKKVSGSKVTSCGGNAGKFFGFVHVGKQLIYAIDASGYMAFSDDADVIKKAVCSVIQKYQCGTAPNNPYKAYVVDAANSKIVATLGEMKVVEVPWNDVK